MYGSAGSTAQPCSDAKGHALMAYVYQSPTRTHTAQHSPTKKVDTCELDRRRSGQHCLRQAGRVTASTSTAHIRRQPCHRLFALLRSVPTRPSARTLHALQPAHRPTHIAPLGPRSPTRPNPRLPLQTTHAPTPHACPPPCSRPMPRPHQPTLLSAPFDTTGAQGN